MEQVRIMLPNAKCNLKCKYCINRDNIVGIKTNIDYQKMFSVLDKYWFSYISVWGGEPLFNPNLEDVLRNLRKKYPDKTIHILSNGTLLNDKFVDLFNELDITYGISHDGHAQHLRTAHDFLKDESYIAMINRLKHFLGFNVVSSCEAVDFVKEFEYFQNLDIAGDWQVTFGQFELTSDEGLRYMPKTSQLAIYKQTLKEIFRMAKTEPKLANYAYRRRHILGCQGYRCGCERRLTIDTNGVIYLCQVAADRNDPTKYQLAIPNMCAKCNYAEACKGICPMLPDRYRKKLCMLYKIWFDVVRELEEEEKKHEKS